MDTLRRSYVQNWELLEMQQTFVSAATDVGDLVRAIGMGGAGNGHVRPLDNNANTIPGHLRGVPKAEEEKAQERVSRS